jgi:formate C-acetyltransferase
LRWAAFAEQKGMTEVAAVLRKNAVREPRTFREALQWALVYDRAQETEGEDVRSQGIFDRLFLKYYRDDIAAGRETRESAKRLMVDFYTRFHSQQHPNNKNITFGGYGPDGEPVWNELTELGFEVFRELERINPKLTYRFGAKTPRWQIEKVSQCIAEGKNSIVFACEETIADAFKRRGKSAEDICDYVLVGCYEPGIGGREVVASMSLDVNLAKPLEAVFNSGKTFDGVRIGPDCDLPNDGVEFEREYLRQLDAMLVTALESTRTLEQHWYELNPAPLHSGAFRDCIANARDYSQGGCKYNSSGVDCSGLGTVADSLAAVHYLVDEKKLVTLQELRDALIAEWKGCEELRLRVMRQAPKWGNNHDRVDVVAKRVYDALVNRINTTRNGHGGFFQAGLWSINLDMQFGKRTAATPDGRRRGDALSRNNVATAGCGKEGPLALMHSNLKLDLAESPDGHIMDVILPLSVARRPTAAQDIATILATYFKNGGQCIHLNCFDSALLREATAHPEKYPDLQVRVCGWNVKWNDLSPQEKRHFIATTEALE